MLSGCRGCARRRRPGMRSTGARPRAGIRRCQRPIRCDVSRLSDACRDRQFTWRRSCLCRLRGGLSIGGNRRGAALYLTVACATTAAWSAAVAIASLMGATRTLPELVLEMLRSATWIAFLYQLLGESVKS